MCTNFLLLTFLQITYSIGDPLVSLPNGWIRGRRAVTLKNNSFYAFEKIPYAEPPIGNLRFKAPQPPQDWDGILDTTHMDVICYQLTRKGPESEDCLYLNVFTPQLPTDRDGELLPVMFYVHGGGFYDGTARNLGPDRFIDEDVIYVTVNYRLAAFGFLSTGDGVIPGNNGLKDQFLALQWVHTNIGEFGGDPKRVTIFGHSAGGASVAFLQLNPKSEGLFSGAICQSGTHLGAWALQREPRKTAFAFATLLNGTFGTNNNTEDLLEYLLTESPRNLARAAYGLYYGHLFNGTAEHAPHMQGTYLGPVIEPANDEAFLTGKIYELVRDGQFVRVPLMIGVTSEECIEYYRDVNGTKRAMEDYDEHVDWLVPTSMEITDEASRVSMGRSIKDIYTKGEPFVNHTGKGIVFCSDNQLNRPSMKHAELNSKFVKTYFYVFTYDGKLGNIDVHLDGARKVGHGEENKYLVCSGTSCDLSGYPKSDQITQQRLSTIWANFAKYRNPTPKAVEVLQNVTWPQLDPHNGNFPYLDIGDNLEVRNNPFETYSRWNELFDSLGYDNFVTY